MSSSEDCSSKQPQVQDSPQSENSSESFLKEKKSRILTAVVENRLDVLIELFDSPKWYDIDAYGSYSYLQVAILRDSKEVFDYMLSIPNFPLEYVNLKGETALVVALDGYIAEDRFVNEHFSYELVKKGACLDVVRFLSNTPLHCAVRRSYCKLVKLLLEKGVDVNAHNIRGQTPLELISTSSNHFEEILNVLLLYGAEPSVQIFEKCVLEKKPLHVQEVLFFYLFDEYSTFEITFTVLFTLFTSPLFHELIKSPVRLRFEQYDMFVYFQMLCRIKIDHLEIIIEKFHDSLRQAFEETESISRFKIFQFSDAIDIRNLSLLAESNLNLKPAVMDFLEIWSSRGMGRHLIRPSHTESVTTELYCYLLSYGFDIEEEDLQRVYDKFGYCELFKIFLHMDIKMGVSKYHIGNIMAVLIYDVNMSLSKFFENPNKYRCMEKLLDYFANPKLKAVYIEQANCGLVSLKRNLTEMPLLEELARNTFREFLIKKFQIKTSRQFYTLVKCLPISETHKKVITYETKLY